MKGLQNIWQVISKICGLTLVFLVMFSGSQPRVYRGSSETEMHLYTDSLFIIRNDDDTCAAAKVVMIDDNLANLYSQSLLYRFKEGMSVESDTCYADSCDIVFEFPNLDCDILISFYYCPKSIYDVSPLPIIPNEKIVWLFSGPYYLRTEYMSKGTTSCAFRVPKGPVHFEFALEAIGFPPTIIEGKQYGLTQNPCIYAIDPYGLEDPDVFNTNSRDKRFIFPKVDKKLFSMWFFNGDLARITYQSIEWKEWKCYWRGDGEDDEEEEDN